MVIVTHPLQTIDHFYYTQNHLSVLTPTNKRYSHSPRLYSQIHKNTKESSSVINANNRYQYSLPLVSQGVLYPYS